MILKTTIEVYTKINEEDTERFKVLPGPQQSEMLANNVRLIREILEDEFPEGSEFKIDITEVPEWLN